ncbi:hypothetical protein JRF84_31070 [Methylobacterium organophilum]|jgi:hypothetical protein|uniref:hypothetical protein n=1 Tax=Methylobacterium organophilum TaxID=410 RepID=UPI0019D2C3FA|nr:hypothetical protein [Methylobacterium organophilum]MBN6824008.1 hypothetical protein [Methylobacterium organophilum]
MSAREIDLIAAEQALIDLEGIADLLNDASHSRERDPGQRGVQTASGYLFEVHERLVRALGLHKEGSR